MLGGSVDVLGREEHDDLDPEAPMGLAARLIVAALTLSVSAGRSSVTISYRWERSLPA